MDLPSGTVTFLFTDIEGSSRLWELHPTAMGEAVARHDRLLQAAVVENHGHVVKMLGDGLHAVFATVQDAVAAAVAGQRALQAEEWGGSIALMPVRMGLYSGTAQLREGDYYGPAVNRAARLQNAAHGGQILLSQASARLFSDRQSDDIALRDLGRYQIRDFPAPERVYQLLVPGLREGFPPLRVTGGQRTNLLPPKTSFIGRERELAAAMQLLDEARLVTLTGPGGTGKTRLALQVAAEHSERYRDGVWLVELASLTEGQMVLPAIAKVFALRSEPQRSLGTILADFLRGKEMLLLLDNCEHLIETCAAMSEKFLDSAPGLTILASSREALGVLGEMILRVPSLTVPAGDGATAATLRSSEAVQLLLERGRAVQPEFQLTDENATAIAEICRRLDGIPLAIELAASRLRLFSAQQLAARLNDRFRLLTGGSRTALPRQQTLGALIDWSYELLSAEEQALFRWLSVFAGGWTFEAAEALGDGSDVLDLLDQLVNKSLVQTEQVASGTRFGYLETIRQYARERLFGAGEGEKIRDLHFAYYSKLVADEVKKFDGPHRDQVRLTLRLEIENFRQALEWQVRRDTVVAIDMLAGVVSFMMQDGGWGNEHTAISRMDVVAWLKAASESLEARGPGEGDGLRRSWAIIYLVGGQSALGAGKFDLVRQETAKAIALARELDDRFLLMAALGFNAIGASAAQRYDQVAIDAAEECRALARELGSSYYESIGLNALAGHELQQGNEETAQAYLAEAATGGDFMGAMALFQTGVSLAHTGGDMSKALRYLQESRQLFESLENAHFVAISTSEMAHVWRWRGELDAAEAGYRDSLAAFHWQGHFSAVAHDLECMAFIARRRNASERAACLLAAAGALRERIGMPMLPEEQGEYEQELAALQQALDAEEFQRAWITGSIMDVDQAVDYALAAPTAGEDPGAPDIEG